MCIATIQTVMTEVLLPVHGQSIGIYLRKAVILISWLIGVVSVVYQARMRALFTGNSAFKAQFKVSSN